MPKIRRWMMTEPGKPLEARESDAPKLAPHEVLVQVAGCGVCHTDLGYYYEGVPTRGALPLTLGHEVAGFVVDAGARHAPLAGTAVVVPAVLPCGTCPACKAGLGTVCPKQFMPGNDGHGGFASHLVVPGRGLCPVPGALSGDPDRPLGAAKVTLRQLSVLADAASTAWQSVLRSGLEPGGVAVVVGAGGVGIFAVQLAHAIGAKVVAIDVDERRLEQAGALGADLVIDSKEGFRAVRGALGAFTKAAGVSFGVRVFECSGHPDGQTLAYGLLGYAGVLMVVGYSTAKPPLHLSRLMAMDARAIGNWGCLPEHYPGLLEMVLDGRVAVAPLVQEFPLDDVQSVLDAVRAHEIAARPVLVP